MNILDKIIAQKKIEVADRKIRLSVEELMQYEFYNRPTISLCSFLLDENKTGIIAEFKRRSPSKGVINATADVAEVTGAYTANGASGLSVLTDEQFFGGSSDDLIKARVNAIPILRKDFIIDEYQVTEAKAIGADVILLIAANLSTQRVKELAAFAKHLQLEVLLEIHNEEELAHICDEVDLVGVNNRNLKTFEVDLQTSLRLIHHIPSSKPAIAESGINNVESLVILKQAGFKGFLIGENFMKQPDPGKAFGEYVKIWNQQRKQS